MEILFLTGRSGAGKSQAANILEDWGYTCVDNIPVELIRSLVQLHRAKSQSDGKLAIVVDVRNTDDLSTTLPLIEEIRQSGDDCRLIYLDSRDSVIINRYKFTRRLHPLSLRLNANIEEALLEEKKLLHPLRDASDNVLDTSDITPHQLQEVLSSLLCRDSKNGIFIVCLSFGFKSGIPLDADTVLDVRCFPNPYYIESMRNKTGLDEEVNSYVFSFDSTQKYMEYLKEYFLYMLPLYEKEGKKQFTIAIGCTGGKHRSVAIADRLNTILAESGYHSTVLHRDAHEKV